MAPTTSPKPSPSTTPRCRSIAAAMAANSDQALTQRRDLSKEEPEIKHIGLIGYPVGHSLSPLMQQAAFDHSGIPGHYELWETPPGELEARIADLRWPEYRGAN